VIASLRSGLRSALALVSPRLRHRLKSLLARPMPAMGAGACLDRSVHVIGARAVRVARNSVVSEGTWLNVNDIREGEFSIDIRENCFVGKRNFFSSGRKIELMPYTLTAVDCKFIGSSHVVTDPYVPVLTSGTTADWNIRIGVNCFLGAGVAVIGNVSIGHGCVIGALSMVTSDIPPFSMAVGNPARVIKRFSHTTRAWVAVDSFSEAEVGQIPDESAYLRQLADAFGDTRMPLPAMGRDMGNT
jgi:acetyltransferase-like isoleucine patch superfamily enzyme